MKVERRLVFNNYILNQLGFEDQKELYKIISEKNEGFGPDGHSNYLGSLKGRKGSSLPDDKLVDFDENIYNLVQHMRVKRPDFNLRYFQYLALLFTEIYLHNFYTRKDAFIEDLNQFSHEYCKRNGIFKDDEKLFDEHELRKIAFWMATGSGKTLLFHMNYWQILRYDRDWNFIVLVTPNEGLSRQHIEEMEKSGVPCKWYRGDLNELQPGTEHQVAVIEITKLTENKTGEGKSIDIEFFEGNHSKNLIFVDEGHKGQASGNTVKGEEKAWKNRRESLSESGFVAEYSATFGQILSDADKHELTREYAASILFNYSYKYFYDDGFGKDFYVYNMKPGMYDDAKRKRMLTANLLSYYEQCVLYDSSREERRKYMIEKPLWIFVGHTVSGGDQNQKDKATVSDVIQVVQFIKEILDNRVKLKENVQDALDNKEEIFTDTHEEHLSMVKKTTDSLIKNIYERLFGKQGALELWDIEGAEGEIALKTSESEKYFGLINIGDTSEFKKRLAEINIEVQTDKMSGSLFGGIDDSKSTLNILIGAKKFIEGWNSWRVSTMTLINIGSSEGTQIIQLFGRGVRLKGENFSLKREESSMNNHIKKLQTLYIFGFKADYVETFLKSVEKEAGESYEEIRIPIKFNKQRNWEKKLYSIETDDDYNFYNQVVILKKDPKLIKKTKYDIRPAFAGYHGYTIQDNDARADNIATENIKEYMNYVNWTHVYDSILKYKIERRYYNLSFDMNILKKIIDDNNVQIIADEDQFIITQAGSVSYKTIKRIEDIIAGYLKKYIQLYMVREKKNAEREHQKLGQLDLFSDMATGNLRISDKKNLYITVKIPSNAKDLVSEDYGQRIQQLAEQIEDDIKKHEDTDTLPSIYFDAHLYEPIPYDKGEENEYITIPTKLNEGEKRFIEDLRDYVNNNKSTLKSDGKSIFVLRNLPKRGIGFTLDSGELFYPDFIVWVKMADKQRMVFVDPKGLTHALEGFENPKVKFFYDNIKEIEKHLRSSSASNNDLGEFQLDGYNVSVTDIDELSQFHTDNIDEFKNKHVLFQDENLDYIGVIVNGFKK